ncbi:MAG: metalloregulator ArsR/SmtB family transcription factor [Gammaproteobacteria bacterium]|nr:metalloregulator ArsR/SmtB family transcription factor [Gammaproteobacteria bacterium]
MSIAESAEEAVGLLKVLANKDRLMVLCILSEGERCVSELETELQIRQPTLSQQLARLRSDNLVETRREGKVIYYRLADSHATRVIELLHDIYCAEQ